MQVDYGSASSLASQSAEDLGRESELSTVGQLEERSKNRMDTKNILRYLKPYIYRYTYIIKYIYIWYPPPPKKKGTTFIKFPGIYSVYSYFFDINN